MCIRVDGLMNGLMVSANNNAIIQLRAPLIERNRRANECNSCYVTRILISAIYFHPLSPNAPPRSYLLFFSPQSVILFPSRSRLRVYPVNFVTSLHPSVLYCLPLYKSCSLSACIFCSFSSKLSVVLNAT